MGGRVNSGLHLDGVSKQAGLPRIMFDSLSEKLQSALGGIRNQGRLNEKDIDKVSREIRLALLEADVNYKVVKDFVRKVKALSLIHISEPTRRTPISYAVFCLKKKKKNKKKPK